MGVSLPLCCFSGCNTLLSGWMGPGAWGGFQVDDEGWLIRHFRVD